MKEIFTKIPELYRSWGRVFAVSLLLNSVAWLFIGLFLTADYFDKNAFDTLRVLDKDNTLGYLAVIFAVLIPVFMRYIQQMVNAGYVFRKALPRIFLFREILVVLVVSSFHVLISTREAFIYFPVLLMTLASLYVIFSALSITFQFDLYKKRITRHLKDAASNSAQLMIDSRITNNEAMEALKNNPYIKLGSYHKHSEALEAHAVLSNGETYITLGKEEEIQKLLNKNFQENLKSEEGTSETSVREEVLYPHFDLEAFPGSQLERGDRLGWLYLPKDVEPQPYLKKIRKVYSASLALPIKHPAIRHFDELIGDIEQGVDFAIKSNDEKSLKNMLEHYEAVTEGMDRYIKTREVKEYNLDSAKEELKRFSNDDLGSRLNTAFDILFNAAEKIFKSENEELSKVLVRFVYGNLIEHTQRINISGIARYETLFMHFIGLFVYGNTWNSSLSSAQEAILDSLLFRIKEHTGSLPYSYERVQDEEKSLYKQKERDAISSWIRLRVDNLRSLSLSSIKNNKLEVYKAMVSAVSDLDKDSRYSSSKLEDRLTRYVKCSLLLTYAYATHSKKDEEVLNPIAEVVREWDDNTLTQIVLWCHKERFADKWRIDTYDLPADGSMHSVPNYDLVLKSVWIELMLFREHFVDNPDYYGDKKIYEETTFFTDGVSSDANNTLLSKIEEAKADKDTKERLSKLVKSFIDIRRDWEVSTLAAKDLDQDRVREFREAANTSYLEYSVTNKLMPSGSVELVKDPKSKNYKRVGINQIFDKEAFIDEWHIGYSNDYFGKQVGENIAQTQDNNVLYEVLKSYTSESSFEELWQKLQKHGSKWFVFGNNIGSWDIEYKLSEYVRRSSKDNEITFKKLKKYEAISFGYIDSLPSGLFFVPGDNVGTLKVKAKDKTEMVEVTVTAYSHDTRLLNELLSSPPDWLKEKGSKKDQRNYLVKKVRLLINYVYSYRPPKEPFVWHFPMKDD